LDQRAINKGTIRSNDCLLSLTSQSRVQSILSVLGRVDYDRESVPPELQNRRLCEFLVGTLKSAEHLLTSIWTRCMRVNQARNWASVVMR
jgi:hypothetical protein